MRYLKMIVCAALLLFVAGAASAQQDYINNFAGSGPDNVPATTAPVYTPMQVAVDRNGNVYFVSQGSNYQHKAWEIVKSTGTLVNIAGGPYYGYSGDGALGPNGQLYYPIGIAVDYNGNVFIGDSDNQIIRKVNAGTGIITTIAGTPTVAGFGGDSGPATSTVAHLYTPSGIAIDKNGNLYIADYSNQRIRMVSCATVNSSGGACTPNAGQTAGDIYTVAGTGSAGFNGDSQPATSANLYNPYGVTTDTAGNLYIADYSDARVRRVACGTGISGCTAPAGETSGDIYTVAGNGTAGFSGDAAAATSAELDQPADVAIDNAGNLFIADESNQRIREVSCVTTASGGGACTPSTGQTAGNIYTAVGSGTAGYGSGDGQPATSGDLYYPLGVAVDSAGNVIVGDYDNDRIRFVPCDVSTLTCTPPAGDTAKDIYTIAGTGGVSYYGNAVAALDSELYYPTDAASDSSGNIYIADRDNCVVREVSFSTGNISTFAGISGSCTYGGDGGPATSAHLNSPAGVTVDSSGNVYIADESNCLVRKVSGGTITTIAGKAPSLACGYTGDGGAATSAELYYPFGVAVDASGNVYIADEYNHVIRKVSGGTITTFAGNNTAGYGGDGGPATQAELYYPPQVAVDSVGNVYIADQYNQRIRKVNTSGIITTIAGNGAYGYQGDGVFATQTSLYYPIGVGVDLAGDVLIGDTDNQRVRLVDTSGIIHTIAGTATAGYNGNDILGTTARVYQPYGVKVDPAGNIYEADYNNWLIRRITALVVVGAVPSAVTFDTQLVGTSSTGTNVTITANGLADISISTTAGFSETDDCPSTLNSGQSCTITVYFSPTTSGIINGQLTITYAGYFAPNTIVNLTGTATALTISPSPLLFGSDTEGTPTSKTVTVTGNTTYSGSPTLTGSGAAAYSISSTTCTGHITTSCAIVVQFDPTATSTYNATLVIHDNDPTSPQLVAVSGAGCVSCALETFTPSSIAFPVNVLKVSSKATKVTFTNNNASSLTITKPIATAGFKVNTTGLSAPICSVSASTVVASGGTCSFNVVFDPTVTGTTNGTVKTTFPADSDGNTSLTLNVSGLGTAVKPSKTTIAFGTVTTGTKDETLTITNEGTAALTFSGTSITGTGNGQFAVLGTSTCPTATLTNLQTCTYIIQFTHDPDSNSYSVDLNISSSDPETPTVVVMTAKD